MGFVIFFRAIRCWGMSILVCCTGKKNIERTLIKELIVCRQRTITGNVFGFHIMGNILFLFGVTSAIEFRGKNNTTDLNNRISISICLRFAY